MDNTISVTENSDMQTEQNQLNLNDIQNLLIIVDLASQRGAFRGAELGQVGPVFDRVSKFLQSVAPPQTETTQSPITQTEVLKPTMPVFNNIGAN